MTTRTIFCRGCKASLYETTTVCPWCGGTNFEAAYSQEPEEPMITVPRRLLVIIVNHYYIEEKEHWATNGNPEGHIYYPLREIKRAVER
mgnify:CR=1 FL=1